MSDNASLLIGDSTTDESLIDKARSFLPQWQPIDKLSTLKTLCLKAVRQNFKNLASPLQNYDPILLEEVVADPSSLAFPINDSARNIGHEGFWKRETLNTFGESECKLVSNGIVSWKRLFCEKTLSRSLGGTKDSDNGLISMVRLVKLFLLPLKFINYFLLVNTQVNNRSGLCNAGLHFLNRDTKCRHQSFVRRSVDPT